MARAKVVHSQDAVTVLFEGNPASPEPSTGVIKFPGGHVEVSRCTDGSYWAHLAVVAGANIVSGRIDRADQQQAVEAMPNAGVITKMALRVSNTVPHFSAD